MNFIVLLVLVLPNTIALSFNDGFPTKCKNFSDSRSDNPSSDFGTHFLTVPAHLTSSRQKDIKFFLATSKASHQNQCDSPKIVEIPLRIDKGQYGQSSTSKYPFQDPWQFANDTYFTVDGYLHLQGSNFLNPDDYCVESISDTKFVIKMCKVNCSADLSKTYLLTTNNEPYEQSRICIPKCCKIGETLSLEDNTCRKLNDTGTNYFMPYLHLKDKIWFLKESKLKNVDTDKVLVRPILGRRQTWNSTHGISGGGQIRGLLHFTRNKINCNRFTSEYIKYEDVANNGANAKNKHNFRVEVSSGGVKVALLTRSRKWLEFKREFCVDGLDGWGRNEEKLAVNQVVLFWQNDDDFSDKIRFADEKKDLKIYSVEFAYMVVNLILAIMLIFGSLMFWQIRKKLNFKGNLIRGHLNSLANLYLYTFVVLVVSTSEHARVSSNAVTVVSSEYQEGKRIGWVCVLIGIVCHYAYLSVFFWIGAMMWYDLCGFSENTRKGMSLMVGLGVPLILMIAFGIADVVYSDPWSDAIVPDYGVESCFIASWSAGYYLHLLVAIIVGLAIVYAFVWFIRKFIANRKEDVEKGKVDLNSISLFVVVLAALTLRWIIDATKWLRVYSGQPEDNWIQTILLFVVLFVPAIALFHVYCINEVVLGLVGDKINSVQSLAKALKNMNLVWSERGLVGQICDEITDEDTVIIEGGVIFRKGRPQQF